VGEIVVRILGGLTPDQFLRKHWQKKPLLVRQALPGFKGICDRETLFALSSREDAISRAVVEHPRRRRDRWELHEGPFADLQLPPSHSTMLVQGVEGLLHGGWEILKEFSFIPSARIDDLMISYATPNGSVGPHEDLYDVFLLQGPGRRRWQIATKHDHTVDETAPIKLLKNFTPEQEWVLEPGDMLYLPPRVAHWGVAVDECFTYSIGFLAPSHEALVQNFLVYFGQRLQQSMPADGIYSDPDLKPAQESPALHDDMIAQVKKLFGVIRFDDDDVADFLGRLLTAPKPNVMFTPPARPMTRDAFAKKLRSQGRLALALPSRGLVRGRRAFLNADARDVVSAEIVALLRDRSISTPVRLKEDAIGFLYDAYCSGWIEVGR
jgi:50S ribosomal protein L16 3-hydroxylase